MISLVEIGLVVWEKKYKNVNEQFTGGQTDTGRHVIGSGVLKNYTLENLNDGKCEALIFFNKTFQLSHLTYVRPIQCKWGRKVPNFCCRMSSVCRREFSGGHGP